VIAHEEAPSEGPSCL